jgi:hypothetical protein
VSGGGGLTSGVIDVAVATCERRASRAKEKDTSATRIELSGIDRIRLRDGLVRENVIRFDRTESAERSGLTTPF